MADSGSGFGKKSLLKGSVVLGTGRLKVTKPGKKLCKCKPKLICVGGQWTGFLMSVNQDRDKMKAKICSKDNKSIKKKEYYDMRVEDHNVKTSTGNKANQLLKKCKKKSGSPCSSPDGGVDMPILLVRKKDNRCDIDEITNQILEEINNEFANPFTPLNALMDKLDPDFLKYADQDILDHYSKFADEFVKRHPKYVKCVHQFAVPEEDRKGNDLVPMPTECFDVLQLDANNVPMLDSNGNFVYKSGMTEQDLSNCLEKSVTPVLSSPCPDCMSYVDTDGKPIEPGYTLCANLRCNGDKFINQVCPDCLSYTELDPSGNRIKSPIFVKFTDVNNAGEFDRYEYMYDVCAIQKCMPTDFFEEECPDCDNIPNPNDMVHVDWKCPDCPEELQYVTNLEKCMYECRTSSLQVDCPECESWDTLGYDSKYLCFIDKCVKSNCDDYAFFQGGLLDIAKEHGLFSDEYINALKDYIDDNILNASNITTIYPDYCPDTLSIFGKDSEEFINYLSYISGLHVLSVKGSVHETFSFDYLLECLNSYTDLCVISKVSKTCDQVTEYCINQIAKDINDDIFFPKGLYESKERWLNPIENIPSCDTVSGIELMRVHGYNPLYINKPMGDGITQSKYIDREHNTELTKTHYSSVTVQEAIAYVKALGYTIIDDDLLQSYIETLVKNHVSIYKDSELFWDNISIDEPCKVYINTNPVIDDQLIIDLVKEDLIEPYHDKDIAKIEMILESTCVDILDSMYHNDKELRKLLEDKGILDNIDESKEYIKFKIMTSVDLVDLVEYLTHECVEYTTSILEYITGKKSLIHLEPDRFIINKHPSSSITDLYIKSTNFIDTPEEAVSISIDSVDYQFDPATIFPKIKAPMEMVRKHLEQVRYEHWLKSEEYINSIQVDLFIPQPKDTPIDDREFDLPSIPDKDTPIDDREYQEKDEQINEVPIDDKEYQERNSGINEVPIDDKEYQETDEQIIRRYVSTYLYKENDYEKPVEVFLNVQKHIDKPRIVIHIKVNEEVYKRLQETNTPEQEIRDDIDDFLKKMDDLRDLKLFDMPIEVVVYRDTIQNNIVVDIK